MKLITVLFLMVAALGVSAQNRMFRWQDELCTYSGTYDPRKVSLAKIRNTEKLVRPGSYSLSTRAFVFKPEHLATGINVNALDAEYRRLSAELKSLDVVDVPYWQDMKRRKLKEMEQVYKLERTNMLGYTNPSVLLDYPGAEECKTKFARPLAAGGDDLLRAWRTVNESSRENNADPERMRREFERQMASPDRMKFALVEVMGFGWGNCANALIDYVDYDGTPDREFKKLFTRVRTISCDEP
jgi:hypothetical protein